MKIKFIPLILVFLLGGCASTPADYKPVPELFKGQSGWTSVEGTTKLLATQVGDDQIIAEREVKFVRTGTLLTDVKAGLGITKMKAGSPVYAASYGNAFGGTNYGAVAWCAPAAVKQNLGTYLTGENDVECLQFNRRTGVATLMDGGGKSDFFSRSMTTDDYSPKVALPQIREEDVDFGRRLMLQLRASGIEGERFLPTVYLDDGVDAIPISSVSYNARVRYDADNSYLWNVWGGQLRLTQIEADGETKLTVEQVKPFQDIDRAASMAQIQALLQSAINAQAEKANVSDKGKTVK